MSNNDVTIGDFQAFMIDSQFICMSSGEYEYGCDIEVSEWEAVKSDIDNMIAESKAEGDDQ